MDLRGALRHTALPLVAAVLAPAATAHAWQAFPGTTTVPANQPAFTLANEQPVASPMLTLGVVDTTSETLVPCDLITLDDPSGDGSIEHLYALVPREALPVGAIVAFHYPYLGAPSTTTYTVADALSPLSGDAVITRSYVVRLAGSTPTQIDATLVATTSGDGDLSAWGSTLDMRVLADDVLVSAAPREIGSHVVSWNVPIDCTGATPGDPHFVAVGDHLVHVRIGGYGVTPMIDTRTRVTIDCTPTAYVDASDGHTLTPDEIEARLGPQSDAGSSPGPDGGVSRRDGGHPTYHVVDRGSALCSASPTQRGATRSMIVIGLAIALAWSRRRRR